MSEPINSGIVKDVLTKFSKFIEKNSIKLNNKYGVASEDTKEVKDDTGESIGWAFTAITGNDHKVHVKVLQSAGRTNIYDVYCVSEENKKKKYTHQTQNDVENCIVEFIEDNYGAESLENYENNSDTKDFNVDDEDFDNNAVESDEDVESSTSLTCNKKLQVEISKIKASNEISLNKVFCNYNAVDAYDDLENVLDDSNFNSMLNEDLQCFEIIPVEDEYSINIIDRIQPMNATSLIIRSQFITLMQLYATKWNSDCMLDRSPLSYINTIRWQLDFMISSRLSAINVDIKEILKSIQPDEIEPDGDVSNIVENYCVTLDLYYPNFDHEIQKLLDDWLLSLRYDR